MSYTPKLSLPYIATGQAQKETTHNDALNDLDFLAQASVINRTTNTPPGSPATGDSYIVGSSPTGAWAGQANYVVGYFAGWRSKAPQTGWNAWVQAENRLVYYTGSAWANLATPFLQASATWDPPSIAAGGTALSSDIAVTSAALGDFVQVAAPYDLQGLNATAYVRTAGQVRVVLHNPTAGAIDLASGNWTVRVVKP